MLTIQTPVKDFPNPARHSPCQNPLYSIYWPLRRQEPLDTRTWAIFIDLLSCGGRIRLGNLREHMYIKIHLARSLRLCPRAPHKGYIQPLAIFFWLDAIYVGPGLRVTADYTHREYRLSESTVATPADETCTSPACQCRLRRLQLRCRSLHHEALVSRANLHCRI